MTSDIEGSFMTVTCLFCLLDPLGAGQYEPAPAGSISEHGYALCADHHRMHGHEKLLAFSSFLDVAMTSGFDDSTVSCPVCGTELKPGDEMTGPCSECEWEAPRPTFEWRMAWAGSRRPAPSWS